MQAAAWIYAAIRGGVKAALSGARAAEGGRRGTYAMCERKNPNASRSLGPAYPDMIPFSSKAALYYCACWSNSFITGLCFGAKALMYLPL